MVWDVSVHRSNNADVVNDSTDVGKQLTNFDSRFAILIKLEWRLQKAACFPFCF